MVIKAFSLDIPPKWVPLIAFRFILFNVFIYVVVFFFVVVVVVLLTFYN